MTSLGGCAQSGGAPMEHHQPAHVSEQGRKFLRPDETTRLHPKDDLWLARDIQQSQPRAIICRLDINNCVELLFDPKGNPNNWNGVVEDPSRCTRTIYLSSDIPKVDLVRAVLFNSSTGVSELQREQITLKDVGPFVYSVAVGIQHAFEVLKGAKKKLVPVLRSEELTQYLAGKMPASQVWWKERIVRPRGPPKEGRRSTRGKPRPIKNEDGSPIEDAIDLFVKLCELSANWVKNQQDVSNKALPGYAPWLAALGLSYMQSSSACKERLQKLLGLEKKDKKETKEKEKKYIVQNALGWYSLANLPGATQDGAVSILLPCASQISNTLEQYSTSGHQITASPSSHGSPATWETSLSPPLGPVADEFEALLFAKEPSYPIGTLAADNAIATPEQKNIAMTAQMLTIADFCDGGASGKINQVPQPNHEGFVGTACDPAATTSGTADWQFFNPGYVNQQLGVTQESIPVYVESIPPPSMVASDDALDDWLRLAAPGLAFNLAAVVRERLAAAANRVPAPLPNVV